MGSVDAYDMNARRLKLACFAITVAATALVVLTRGLSEPDALLSSQTMVLAFPVFMSMMTLKSGGYPRLGIALAFAAAALALGALYLSYTG